MAKYVRLVNTNNGNISQCSGKALKAGTFLLHLLSHDRFEKWEVTSGINKHHRELASHLLEECSGRKRGKVGTKQSSSLAR